jgi:hypothetical protein
MGLPVDDGWLRCGGSPELVFEFTLFGECGPDEIGLFFHGWKPLPTAASANGGGDLLDSLLHCAANMASGVPLRLGCS